MIEFEMNSSCYTIKEVSQDELQKEIASDEDGYYYGQTRFRKQLILIDKDLPYERIEVLNKIYSKQVKIVVTTVEAIMQGMIPKAILYKNVLHFCVGNEFECKNFKGAKNLNNLKKKEKNRNVYVL